MAGGKIARENEEYAYVRIVGFTCTADELTSQLGIEPSEAGNMGDPAPDSQPPYRHSTWLLRSRLSKSATLEAHILDVLDQLAGHERQVRDISESPGVTMECVGIYEVFNPGLHLTARTIKRLADFGMSLDLDTYHRYSLNPSVD